MNRVNEIARDAIDRWSVAEYGRDCLDEWAIDVRQWTECQVAFATVELMRRILAEVAGYPSPWNDYVRECTYKHHRREVFFEAAEMGAKKGVCP